MRRRPLLRAAAVGGGAYYAGKRRAEGQEREAEQEQRIDGLEASQAPAPAPSGGGLTSGVIDQLKQLGSLHESGVLTDQEFNDQKAKLLAS